jgi:Putative addiction module component
MSTPAIDLMSWEEKLRALEELWDAITREGDRYESPAWHEQELKETQQRFDAGAEESMDWATAKRDLRR